MSAELREVIESERVPYPDKEKLFTVLGLLLSGRVSLGKAAELLSLRVDDLWILLHRLGVRYSVLDEEEVEEELDAYEKIFKSSAQHLPDNSTG
ncbi:MAG: UPF0175 family protein [Sulfolobales archaeon]